MNCLDWEERIALYAGGDLADPEAPAVERHIADCPGCQVFWSGLRETLGQLREAHAEELAPAHFTAVRARVLAEIERGRSVWRRLAWISGVGLAAVLVLGLALRPGPLPAPPRRVAVSIPQAPLVLTREAPKADRGRQETIVRATVREHRDTAPERGRHKTIVRATTPVLVKWQTADPNIVIYWIGEN